MERPLSGAETPKKDSSSLGDTAGRELSHFPPASRLWLNSILGLSQEAESRVGGLDTGQLPRHRVGWRRQIRRE